MTESACVRINGEDLVVTTAGAVWHPASETLIVADLHFEKGSSFARRGVMLPPYDTRTTLRRLAALAHGLKPKAVISLGDAFHETDAELRMDETDAARLDGLIANCRWTWVLGNHDPMPPRRFAGEVCTAKRIGRLILRHEPINGASAGELAGHLHPCAKIRTDGRTQRRRCFVCDGDRMVLPAFGAYTGGLNVLDEAFDGLFKRFSIWAIGGRGVYPFSQDRLMPDATVSVRRAAG